MVFGWGKKQPEEAPAQKEVSLQDVPGILADIEALRQSRALEEAGRLRDSTAPIVEDLMRIGGLLEQDDLNVDDVDKHIRVIVARGKKQVIDVIKKGVSPLPKVSGADDVNALDSAMSQILKKVGDVLGRQTRVIHIFAKKYAQRLKDGLEVMSANQKEVHRILGEMQSQAESSQRILGLVRQVGSAESAQHTAAEKISGAKREIVTLESDSVSLQKSVEEARSSPEYKKYVELGTELDGLAGQKEQIRSEVGAQFAKISRPLGRYEYGSSLDRDQKGLLEVLVSDPYAVLLPQNADTVILILENVRKAISSGSISVKDVDKSLAHLTETEEALAGFIQKISEYESGRKKLRDQMDSLRPARLEELEGSLAKNKSLCEDLRLKSESLQGEADEAESSIPGLVSEIESALGRFSSTRYVVVYAGAT